MLFCGTELARRIEGAETAMIAACTAAAGQRVGSRDAFTLSIAGGLAAFAGADSPVTKVAGIGFEGVPTAQELARGAAVQVELSNLADPAIGELLTRRGYALVGYENVLGRALRPDAPLAPRAPITIELNQSSELEAWIDVVVVGFASPDGQGIASHESFPREALERTMRDMVRARGLERYLARVDGQAAGGASMRLAEGVAQLCGAATLPQHRRRGVQSAMLERRLSDAARAGCDIAVITTLPGSKSQENAQRQAFDLLYARAILRRSA